jgi:hypothetical protein
MTKEEAIRFLQNPDMNPKLRRQRMHWSRLLKRVFGIDVETCAACGGKMRIIAAIEDPKVIKKILSHLGLPTSPPKLWPARGPPLFELALENEMGESADSDQAYPDDFDDTWTHALAPQVLESQNPGLPPQR